VKENFPLTRKKFYKSRDIRFSKFRPQTQHWNEIRETRRQNGEAARGKILVRNFRADDFLATDQHPPSQILLEELRTGHAHFQECECFWNWKFPPKCKQL